MLRPVRTLLLAIIVCLMAASAGQAAIIGSPEFSASPFTKAQKGAGNAVSSTLVWLPPVFTPASANDKQSIFIQDAAGGNPETFTTTSTAGSFPLLLSDGHVYTFTVAACVTAAVVCDLNSVNTTSGFATTRIDATEPTATVQINGGALATNNRTVSLSLTGADPLIGGVPGTSSGITQSATDVDGDGTFPCVVFGGDTSGCAIPFAATTPATIPPGPDGVKAIGVIVGDGARPVTAPCPPLILCVTLAGSPILGNASAPATDTILLDTVKPVAVATQDRASVDRGGAVVLDSATSVDTSPAATPSGVDPAASVWDFKDGTPPVTAATVTHVYAAAGTFVGQLRVKDRAGNLSDPRSFTVTVTAPAGAAGGGSIAGISGTAGFSISAFTVKATYVRSRLRGSVTISGTSTLAGPFRAELRRARGGVIRAFASPVSATAFAKRLRLPATLLPGTYRLVFIGPGGTLTTTLRLTAPRSGVISAGRVAIAGGTARARFTFAARPALPLRRAVTVAWSQGTRALGRVKATGGRVVTATLPPGARLRPGRLTATLRAGATVVGSARVTVR